MGLPNRGQRKLKIGVAGVVVALTVGGLVAAVLQEVEFRNRRFNDMVDSQVMYRMAGYTSNSGTSFVNTLFDSDGNTPASVEAWLSGGSISTADPRSKGPMPLPKIPGDLYKPDNAIWFWWFERNGTIVHENTFRLNNLGLISVRDYVLERTRPSFRIVVLGDELTAATTADKSWPDHLQDVLNEDAEMLRRLGPIEVTNFGWPDAGFFHFRKYWMEKARRFEPDFVIINIAEQIFGRIHRRPSGPVTGALSKVYFEPFQAPGGLRAWLIVSCYGEGRRLRDPDCNSGRPFGLFLPKQLAHDAPALAAVQDRIVYDYLGRLIWNDWRPTWLLDRFAILEDPLQVRVYKGTKKLPAMPPPTAEEMLENARSNLAAILGDFPNTLIVQNRNYAELMPKPLDRPLARALRQGNPEFAIVDMVDHLPLESGAVDTWYQTGVAAEKWSETGHRVYARAVAKVLRTRLGKLGILGAN